VSPSFFDSVKQLCEETYAGAEVSDQLVVFDLDNFGRTQRIYILVQGHVAMVFSFFASRKDFSADEVFEVASEFIVGINVGPEVDSYSVRQAVFLNLQGWDSALRLSVDEVCRSADDLEKALHGRLDRF
jgi:hypothetical protein